MIFLLASIVLNVGIFVVFRFFSILKINTFQAIVINYITCVVTGLIFVGDYNAVAKISFEKIWVPIGLGLGMVFIGTFYTMARTTQIFSITVSSVASKMSLAIPVLFSLFVFQVESKDFDFFNYAGVFVALLAILLSSIRKSDHVEEIRNKKLILLPVLVFVFGGVIDTTLNFTNLNYLTPAEEPLFPIITFAGAALVGVIISIYRWQRFSIKSIKAGILLGIINYFSVYFILKALSDFDNDGAILWPSLNIGIILLSALISVMAFGEKLSRMNKLGLILALLAIFMISHQEIINMLG